MKITFKLRVSPYDLVRDAVNAGVARGYRRAFKHVDMPAEDDILACVVDTVMGELCDAIDFDTAQEDDEGSEDASK